MTFSKMITGVLGLALLTTMGCSTDSRRGKNTTPGDQLDYKMAAGTNFRAESLKVDSTYNVAYQSNGMVAKKLFNFSSCIKDLGGNPVIPDLQFSIADGAGGTLVRPADRTGCIQWTETYDINELDSETLYLLKRTLSPKTTYRGEVYLEAALNPWADGGATIIDTRRTQLPDSIKIVDAGPLSLKGASFKSKTGGVRSDVKLYVDSISFQALGLDFSNYEINKFLGLTVAHKYRVRLRPTLVRQSLTTEIDPHVINKGRMKVTVTLLKDVEAKKKMDPNNVITSVQFIGDVIYGAVTADITLKLQNISALLSRSQAVVTVEPMDELENVGNASFVGPSNPGPLATISLVPTTENAKDLAQRAGELKASDLATRNSTTPLQLFVQKSHLKPLDLSGHINVRKSWYSITYRELNTQSALDQLIAGQLSENEQRNLEFALCMKVFGSRAPISFCLDSERTMILVNRDIVDSLNSSTPVATGQTTKESLTFVTSVGYSISDSKGHTDSVNAGISAGAGVDLGVSWSPAGMSGLKASGSLSGKVSVGRDWFYTKTAATSRATNIGASSTKNIDVIGNSFVIDANVRSCVVFGMSPSTPASLKLWAKGNEQYFYCSSRIQRQKRVETFYLLDERVGDDTTGFSDSAMPGASPWRMFIRGPKAYLMFAQMVKTLKDQNVVLEKLPENEELMKTMNQFPEFYMMQEFPGILAP